MLHPFVSVVIPVHNDGDRLVYCLEALQDQSYSHYEIIVVDNSSREDIRRICTKFDRVRYCQEWKPGNNAARNKGISLAQGEIIAFTDADCIPDRDWIRQGVAALLNHPEAGIIGGTIEFFFQGNAPNPVEYADSISYLRQWDYVTQEHYAAGANLFTRRQVLEQVGGFEERLLNLGDKEWGQRVYATGWQVLFCPSAIVHHPARSTIQTLLSKGRRQARAAVKLAQLRSETLPQANFLPLDWGFWRAVWIDPNLLTLRQKLVFIWIIHRLKWAIAWELMPTLKT